jgi:hypothetical protein
VEGEVGLVLVSSWRMAEGEVVELEGGGASLVVWEGVEGVKEVGGGEVGLRA